MMKTNEMRPGSGWLPSIRTKLCGSVAPDGKRRGGLCSEEGAELVEFAFSAMAVLFMTFGLMNMGILFFFQNTANEVARETARYASVHATSGCQNSSGGCSTLPSATNTWGGATLPGASLMTVTTQYCDSTGTTCQSSANGSAGGIVKVQAVYTIVDLPFFPNNTVAVQSKAQMPIWQ